MAPILDAACETLFEQWQAAARAGEVRNVLRDASALAQTVIFRGLFSRDVDDLDTRALGQALEVANDFIHRSAWSMVKLPDSIPTPSRVRFRRAMRTLDTIVYDLIAARRARSSEEGDLLGRLVAARDNETGACMTDEQVRDEVMTTFVAGHDTTAAALAWAFWIFANEPQALARLAGVDPDDAALGRTVQEVLRLYPPGWIMVRTPHRDDVVCGYEVPAGAPLLISPWVVHRSPTWWDEPERFDPDRFLPDRVAQRPKFAYFPYGGGARVCIGQGLADRILRHVIAGVASRYVLERGRNQVVVPEPKTTLQPRGGVRLRIRAR